MSAGNVSETASPLALLREGATALGIPLPPEVWPRFQLYLQELKTWNARINLTGLRSDREIVLRGFLESLLVLPHVQECRTLADVGSGAGFPGLVLKLARPQLTLTLVESRGKKAAFLEYLISLLGLSDIEVLQVHLTPSLARTWGPRYQAVTSRGVFSLPRLLATAAPLLLPGGRILAFKGPWIPPRELREAQDRLPALGLQDLRLERYRLPQSDVEGHLALVSRAVTPPCR